MYIQIILLQQYNSFSIERGAVQSSWQEWRWCCEHGWTGFSSCFSTRKVNDPSKIQETKSFGFVCMLLPFASSRDITAYYKFSKSCLFTFFILIWLANFWCSREPLLNCCPVCGEVLQISDPLNSMIHLTLCFDEGTGNQVMAGGFLTDKQASYGYNICKLLLI